MGFDTYLRFIMVLVLVIGMIGFIAWMVRRFGLLNRIAPGASVRSDSRRLSVIESCPVDGKRRLVLVRRDQTEHLILLTGTGSGVVIERGSDKSAAAGRRRKANGKSADKLGSALAREEQARNEQEWGDDAAAEDLAAEDESVTRLASIRKSVWR